MIKEFGNRDKVIKAISVIIIVAVLILSFDVFTQNRDGRKQIVDQDGGIESELCMILSDIDGVGNVDVMLQYDEDDKITGAIVTAEGAGNPVVKNNLINAVMAVFNISSASVEVFEKKSVEEQGETSNEK
jgi:stage III sporulation protein AG